MLFNLTKVNFFWINRDQQSFEWFVQLLSALELEQACICRKTSKQSLIMDSKLWDIYFLQYFLKHFLKDGPSLIINQFWNSRCFCLQASRKKVWEFQNWLMIKLVPSFKLRKSHLYLAFLKTIQIQMLKMLGLPLNFDFWSKLQIKLHLFSLTLKKQWQRFSAPTKQIAAQF